jgi:hypothetical protein
LRIKAPQWKGTVQCINNNITTIVAHPVAKQRKAASTRISKSMTENNKSIIFPRRNLKKPRRRWHKKRVELSVVISLRNTEHPLQNCPVNHLCTSRNAAGREII